MVKKFAKDPKAPKRPQSAYFGFLAANRAKFVAQVGNSKDVAAIAKAAGAAWREASDAVKAPFQAKADKEKAVYTKKRAKYVASPGYKKYCAEKKAFDKKAKVANVKKPASWPKRAMSGYMLFMNDKRPALIAQVGSAKDVAAIAKAAGVAWGSASDAEKAGYQAKAATAKAAYAKAFAKYQNTDDYKNYMQAKADAKKQAKADAKAEKAAAKTPKKSAKKAKKATRKPKKSKKKAARRSKKKAARRSRKKARKARRKAGKRKAGKRKAKRKSAKKAKKASK